MADLDELIDAAEQAQAQARERVQAAKRLAESCAEDHELVNVIIQLFYDADDCAKSWGDTIKIRVNAAKAAFVLLGGAWLVKAAGGPAKVYDFLQQLGHGHGHVVEPQRTAGGHHQRLDDEGVDSVVEVAGDAGRIEAAAVAHQGTV